MLGYWVVYWGGKKNTSFKMIPEQLPGSLTASNYPFNFLPHWYDLLLYCPISDWNIPIFLRYLLSNVFGFQKFRKIKSVFLSVGVSGKEEPDSCIWHNSSSVMMSKAASSGGRQSVFAPGAQMQAEREERRMVMHRTGRECSYAQD